MFSIKYIWIWIVVALVITAIMIYAFKTRINRDKIADLAVAQHAAWNFGNTKENNVSAREALSQYWSAAGAPDYGASKAWSAAFISWLFYISGAGDRFPYSASHHTYIRKAVKNRISGKIRGLIAYRPEERRPKIGDLICYPRQSGVSFATDHAYNSHCDIVVDIDQRSGRLITIGGNVSDSVSKTIYNIDNSGYVQDPKVHVILKNAV